MKINRHSLLSLLAAIVTALSAASCIEDGITTSPSDRPVFSTDTLRMGSMFTGEGSPTHSFKVYNRHDKILNISSIRFRDGGNGMFRVNVDGLSGKEFSNVEIRPNDSIFVFVEATIPATDSQVPFEVTDVLQFITNGQTDEVAVSATGRNYEALRARTITRDTTLRGDIPHRVFDSLTVAPGVTLTLEAGTQLYFHDKAALNIRGTLLSKGTAEAPVTMGGDRTGIVAADIPYEIMSKQWEGVYFSPASRDNHLEYTVIENTVSGLTLDSLSAADPALTALELVNCRLRNSDGYVLDARCSSVKATGCEFAEAAAGILRLQGGSHILSHCTIANYYLFSFISGAAIQLEGTAASGPSDATDAATLAGLSLHMSNCAVYGMSADLSVLDLTDTDVWLRRCLLRSEGEDDEHFTSILWGADPLFTTERDKYLFDYRPLADSPLLGASDPAVTPAGALPLPAADFYGTPHPAIPAIGAFELP